MASAVRVRFAPSPTGYLHVGGARTALFNWLFARHHSGAFILRIEDTDLSRSSQEMVEGILEGLRWMGLDWDEGPFFQSQRIDHYREFARNLLQSGRAYRCFCRPDAEPEGGGSAETSSPRFYDRRCRGIGTAESELRAGREPYAIRFLVPPGKTGYRDQVFGPIEVDHSRIEDFVLLRSDGLPTYHLGVVVDDMEMAVSHVIRGADHISNTPKQVLLYQAAGLPLPHFAHLPLILGPDRQRLSKRHGATSVMSYAETGYLPEAFVNFLALLGWSPGGDRELLSREELIGLFGLEGVGKADAVFGLEKLDWFNGQYIARLPESRLRELVTRELQRQGIWAPGEPPLRPETTDRTLALLRSRARSLSDFGTRFRTYFAEDFSYDAEAAAKFLQDAALPDLMAGVLNSYENSPQFTLQSTESELRVLARERGVKAGLLINAARVGLTGQGVAPGLFEVMQALGRERTLGRLRRLVEYLRRTD